MLIETLIKNELHGTWVENRSLAISRHTPFIEKKPMKKYGIYIFVSLLANSASSLVAY